MSQIYDRGSMYCADKYILKVFKDNNLTRMN